MKKMNKKRYIVLGAVLMFAFFASSFFFIGIKSALADTADCVLVHGTANANISIAFYTINTHPMDDIGVASSTLETAYNGFKKVFPYSTNLDKVAFYLDKFVSTSSDASTWGNSCVDKTIEVFVQSAIPDDNDDYGAGYGGGKVAGIGEGYVQIIKSQNNPHFQFDLIHVLSQAIGRLNNEFTYPIPLPIPPGQFHSSSTMNEYETYEEDQLFGYHSGRQTNCVSKSKVDNYWAPYSFLSSNIDINNPGCAFYTEENHALDPKIEVLYKDKQPSIMTNDFHTLTFNKISCAWIDLALNTPGGLYNRSELMFDANRSQSGFDTILGPHLNNCGAFKTTEFSIDVPIRTNCVPEDYLFDITKNIDASADIIISAKQDIQLQSPLSASWWGNLFGGSNKNFFKINDTDVSVDDGSGGRKIPAGQLIIIPRAKVGDTKFKTGDQYCRTEPISLSFKVDQVSLNSPIGCFGGCR
jgi:hypothetical protein